VKQYKREDNETALRYRRALELANINNADTILDIGCKYAYLRSLLSDNNINADYYGIDISEKVLKQISGFDPKYFKVADASEEIPFEDNRFDYIFALEIMEHVVSPIEMIKEARRTLKENGYLIVSIPNPYCFWEIYANLFKKPDTEGHISSFTHQSIGRLFDFSEMQLVDFCGTSFRVPFSRRINKTLRNKDEYFIIQSNLLFLTRSYIYKVRSN